MIPFKMKLEVPNFQRITTAMLCQPAREVRHGVNEFIGDVQQQLRNNENENK